MQRGIADAQNRHAFLTPNALAASEQMSRLLMIKRRAFLGGSGDGGADHEMELKGMGASVRKLGFSHGSKLSCFFAGISTTCFVAQHRERARDAAPR